MFITETGSTFLPQISRDPPSGQPLQPRLHLLQDLVCSPYGERRPMPGSLISVFPLDSMPHTKYRLLFYPKQRLPACPLLQIIPGAGKWSLSEIIVHYPNWGCWRIQMQPGQYPRAIGTNEGCLRTTGTRGHLCSLPHQCLQPCHTLYRCFTDSALYFLAKRKTMAKCQLPA